MPLARKYLIRQVETIFGSGGPCYVWAVWTPDRRFLGSVSTLQGALAWVDHIEFQKGL